MDKLRKWCREKLTREIDEIRPAGVLYVPVRDPTPDAARGEDDAVLHDLRARALRRSGLLSDDIDLLEAMEKGLAGDGRFIPVRIKMAKPTKKNPEPTPELSALSSVASLERFGRLARYTQKKLAEMGRELLAGSVQADPCVQGGVAQCEFCDYRAACGFDESAGDQYRPLKKWKDGEVWDKLEGKDHDQVDK